METGHLVLMWSFLLLFCPMSSGKVLYNLYSKLLKDCKPYIRPRVDPHDTVDVGVSFILLSVEGLFETTQTLVTSGFFYFISTDEFLSWNASEFSNITNLTLPWEKIWSPDVRVHNSVEDISQMSTEGGHVRVFNTGRVQWNVGVMEITHCAPDMTKCPFDRQICSLKLVQSTSYTNEINISADGIIIDRTLFRANGEWKINVDSFETVPYPADTDLQSELIFTFTPHRKYTYYLITNILPVMPKGGFYRGIFWGNEIREDIPVYTYILII